MSLKCNLVGDSGLQIKYTTVVTFASDLAMSQQMPTLESDAVQATNQYLKEVKKEFKKDVGRALKTKLTIATPSVEIISLQSHISPKRTAYYRYDTLFELS
jgi:tRNA U54 and U55 pseudouridine synthase Pus10